MALLGKRRGAFGIAYEDVPGSAESTATYVLPCDSANIEGVPVTYERVNSIGADPIGREQSGFEYSWSFSGAELSIEEIGYLIWLYLGDEDNVTTPGTHTMPNTAPYSSKHFTIFKDMGGDHRSLGNKRMEVLAGCRMDSLSIEQPHKGYAKVSASGMGRSVAMSNDSLTKTVSYGAMGWHNLLISAGGYLTKGSSGTSPAINLVKAKSFKIEFKREIDRAGRNYSSNNPTAIVEGGRMISAEVNFDLQLHSTISELLTAYEQGGYVSIGAKWNDADASESLLIELPTTQIVNSPKGELGTGTDPQEVTFQFEAFRDADGNNLVDVVSIDGNNNSYADRVGA